ncbi:MAG: hypothetical protein LIO90_04435 [Bacteroidales bacterium]|nr:hypothetical protein [Bacteroidales bacterium]
MRQILFTTIILTAAIFSIAPASAQWTYQHSYFSATFPGKDNFLQDTRDDVDYIDYSDGERILKAVVFPLAMNPEYVYPFTSEVSAYYSGCSPFSTVKIGDYNLSSVEVTPIPYFFGDYSHGRLYTLSNGEVTVVLAEYLKDPAASPWWANHIEWKIPEKSELSLDDRLQKMQDFYNAKLAVENIELRMVDDGGELQFQVVFNDGIADRELSYDRIKNALQKALLSLNVLQEYAENNYNFSVNIRGISGERPFTYEYPFADYSNWENEPEEVGIGG